MTLTVLFALASAFATAVHLLAQHSASIGAPKRHRGWRLARYLLGHPLWLFGWAAAIAAFALQALALHHGQLSIVQPLLVTELVFVLALRQGWIRQHVAHAAWTSAFVTCAALAVFLSVGAPQGGDPAPEAGEWLSALVVFCGIVAACSAIAGRGSPVRRAAIYAAAASMTWALMAAFLKTATDTLTTSGIGAVLTQWPIYALIGAGIVGTLLQQAALHVGPLSASQPLLVVVNPVASIILGVWVFDERFTQSPAEIAIGVVAFAVMAAGVVMLSRTAPSDLAPSRPIRT
jgi:hypothetical protein